MEENINIADILKDKQENTKLYSPLFGDVSLSYVQDGIIKVMNHGGITTFFENGKFYNYPESKPLLFPSESMRDWSKFAWKKGDVLVSEGKGNKLHVIFEGFDDDTYTTFKGKHYLCNYDDDEDYNEEDYNDYNKEVNLRTIEFKKDDVNDARTYISTIEERFGGKLNLENLEIEKHQEFKDGDIITFKNRIIIIYNTSIEKSPIRTEIYYHACLKEGELTVNEYLMSCGFGEGWYSSTEEEKQQLFDALAKEGKAWDAEKKQIVDLKPKIELKPFDKIVGFEVFTKQWVCDMFSHYSKNYEGKEIIIALGGCTYIKALPFNEETAKLIGTTKEVD